ncbi:MAG: TRAP transporter large permease [Planctomycetota bacterium]|jgi:C4-dicarboxylate transporter DctM subunit|nr:TRAP transporter large permease [Planctomycetota bacterium]
MSVTAFILFTILGVCLALRVPISVCLGVSALVANAHSRQIGIRYMVQSMTMALDSFPLLAVPFFVLAGELMGSGGISRRLLAAANAFFGNIVGGIAIVTVVACCIFAAISGSGPATVAAIGGVVVPEMLRQGYDKRFTACLIASAGGIGIIIPPSIPMVVYGVSAGQSVADLFLAGIVPGILIGLLLIAYSYWFSRVHKYPRIEIPKSTFRAALISLWDGKWALFMPGLILGGIYGGIFTPTEAATVAVIYGFLVGKFIYKDLEWRELPILIGRSAITSATVLIIISMATAFGRVLSINRIPAYIAEAITGASQNSMIVIVLIMLLLLIVGCFLDAISAIIILSPILLPIVTRLGINPIHFGIVMIVNLAIGLVTPPLGVNLFVASSITDTSFDKLAKSIWVWVGVMLAALALIILFPSFSLGLVQFIRSW